VLDASFSPEGWCSVVRVFLRRAAAVVVLAFPVLVTAALDKPVSLQGVLAGKAFVAEVTGKRLDSKMDTLVSLQVVISVERLRALIALERPLCLRIRLSAMAVH